MDNKKDNINDEDKDEIEKGVKPKPKLQKTHLIRIMTVFIAILILALKFTSDVNSAQKVAIEEMSEKIEIEKENTRKALEEKSNAIKKIKIAEDKNKKKEEEIEEVKTIIEEVKTEIEEAKTEIKEVETKKKELEKEVEKEKAKVRTLSKSKVTRTESDIADRKVSKSIKNKTVATAKSPSRNSLSRGRIMKAEATAYGATVLNGGAGSGLTSTGRTPIEGRTIAVDKRLIPMGSKVRITCPNYPSVNGVYIAEDVGAAIKGNRIDIYFNDLTLDKHATRKRMLNFGRRSVQLEILE